MINNMYKRILNNKSLSKLFLAPLMLIILSSCAQKMVNNEINDPLESVNRSVFKFNQEFDEFVLEPINQQYDKLPGNVKSGLSNHVTWASTPLTMINSGIQLEAENFSTSSIKFLLNSLTLGFYDLDPETEYKALDFGSSFAKYNVPLPSFKLFKIDPVYVSPFSYEMVLLYSCLLWFFSTFLSSSREFSGSTLLKS